MSEDNTKQFETLRGDKFSFCKNCGAFHLFGTIKYENKNFCNLNCLKEFYRLYEGLCDECLSKCNTENFNGSFSINLIGTSLWGIGINETCSKCKSQIRTKVTFFGLFIPLESYIIKHVNQDRYIGKRLKKNNKMHFLTFYLLDFLIFLMFLILIYYNH